MSLLKGLRHAQACLGETRCSDREGHALAEKALAAAIAAAESAPAVVTAEEIAAVGANCDDWNKRHKYECKEGILEWRSADSEVAALVAERTAAAVEAARAEEREACANVAQTIADGWRDRAAEQFMRGHANRASDSGAKHDTALGITAAIRTRGLSEAPAPERLHGNGAAWTPAQKVSRLEAEIESLHAEADRLRAREARVQALVEAGEGILADLGVGWWPHRDALRAALDALGKEGA